MDLSFKRKNYIDYVPESLAVETGGSKEGSAAPSRAESVMSGDTGEHGEGDDEYSPDVDDDDETIDKEEKEVVPDEEKGNENEIDMLENEADVPLEDLLKKYYPDSVDDLAERATSKKIKDTTEKEEVKDKEDSIEEDVSGTGRSKRRRKPIDFEEVQARIKEEEELQKE